MAINLHATNTISALPISVPGQLPIDWIIVGVVFLISAIDLYRSGPTRSASLSLGAIIALSLYQLLGKTVGIGATIVALPGAAHAVMFAALLIVCYVFLSRIVLPFAPGGNFVQTVLSALATCAILLSVTMQIQPIIDLWHPGALIQDIFSPAYLIFWIVASLAILAFTSL